MGNCMSKDDDPILRGIPTQQGLKPSFIACPPAAPDYSQRYSNTTRIETAVIHAPSKVLNGILRGIPTQQGLKRG